MKNRRCKPNPILCAGLLLSAAAQLAGHSGFLPDFLSCFLMGAALGLMLMGLFFMSDARAARFRAWKRNLFKGGPTC